MHARRIDACMEYDVVVLGLGGMGSAVAAHAARRGLRVAGFEQFPLVHERGSSTGRTRIIRKAYFEDAAYVPLLERAYTLWRELEERSQTALLDLFGVLMLGQPDSVTVAGVTKAAAAYDIAIEHLDAAQLRVRYPRIDAEANEVGVFEPDAGVVFPERAIATHLNDARDAGAALYDEVRIRGYERTGDRIRIHFDGDEPVSAARVAVCGGAWTNDLLPHLQLPLRVQRNVQYWFAPSLPCGPQELPAFFLERASLRAPLYAIPDLGDGFKVAFHGYGETTRADDLDREVRTGEIEAMRETLAKLMPDTTMTLRDAAACMYTLTPDGNFAIGRDPQNPNVVIACGFSGHGFKFVPAIGEIVTQLLLGEAPRLDIGFLGLERLIAGT
ncbi:MAG TPA: N-methyl-L-tryptophan oxidase [Verrucomicrobiae bacterium]|nr:N-methyl-L-tryptophan oxidase [Verrucomicrobiae bacterium]HTZ54641.1 N-methyl-L-tryptophan oxidase [Candidatus Acidoferrum sp.]